MSGSRDYGAVREDAMAEARERVHTLAFQGLSAPEIERRLGYRLTATEWELLRSIARREVESAHMQELEQELEVVSASSPPKRSARDLVLSAARVQGYMDSRRTRRALATALLVLTAAVVGVVIGSVLVSSKPGARHDVRASSTRGSKPTPGDRRGRLANSAGRPAPRRRASQSGSRPVGGSKTAPQAERSSQVDVARAAHLNADGFQLMNVGRYNEAIPLLRHAVSAFPRQSTDVTYAYALYNLGRSLRLAGRPIEAIPLLERRLQIDNQRETVARELAAARRGGRATP